MAKMRRRLLVLGLTAMLLGGCSPSITASLTTPSTPLTYGWVMAEHNQDWGVQIGPKSDGSGYHVAVYAWIGCTPVCMYQYFQEFDALAPLSVHDYNIWWDGHAWEARYRPDASHPWRLMATMYLGDPNQAIFEINCCERTSS